jgi:hypothetical protein
MGIMGGGTRPEQEANYAGFVKANKESLRRGTVVEKRQERGQGSPGMPTAEQTMPTFFENMRKREQGRSSQKPSEPTNASKPDSAKPESASAKKTASKGAKVSAAASKRKGAIKDGAKETLTKNLETVSKSGKKGTSVKSKKKGTSNKKSSKDDEE